MVKLVNVDVKRLRGWGTGSPNNVNMHGVDVLCEAREVLAPLLRFCAIRTGQKSCRKELARVRLSTRFATSSANHKCGQFVQCER